jgi:hypothetical protein
MTPFPDTLLVDYWFQRSPKYVDAAHVGFGLGMCRHYLSTGQCNQEEKEMYDALGRYRNLLSVHVTRRGLGLDVRQNLVLARTEVLYWQQHDSYFDAGLGAKNVSAGWDEPEDEDAYWQSFRTFVGHVVGRFYSNVTDVFMIGESAVLPGFKENVVRAVMEAGLPEQNRDIIVHQDKYRSIFAVSKGAAEIAKRILVSPTGWAYPAGVEGLPRCRP